MENKMLHSSIVGGSTASRVINCPGSVALVAKMPPKPSSTYADEGTLLHDAIALILDGKETQQSVIGMKYEGIELTQELFDEKLAPALAALDEIDPNNEMDYLVETKVSFGDLIPGAFGSTDLMGRLGDRAIVLDWKFGSGVAVSAENNYQGMYYAAAAMRTLGCDWVFRDAKEIEIIIVQPPAVKRWVTTFGRIKEFERELVLAVKKSADVDAPLNMGSHCRWCAAKPTCPQMTGAVDRVVKSQMQNIDAANLAKYLEQADLVEQWVSDLRALAFELLEKDMPVPGYKLVAKRGTRQWVDENKVESELKSFIKSDLMYTKKIISPAQAEKILKKAKLELPEGLTVSVSSGSTLARDSDPRPAIVNIGKQLTDALIKLQ
jgi:HD superfamily phosphodiesterase